MERPPRRLFPEMRDHLILLIQLGCADLALRHIELFFSEEFTSDMTGASFYDELMEVFEVAGDRSAYRQFRARFPFALPHDCCP